MKKNRSNIFLAVALFLVALNMAKWTNRSETTEKHKHYEASTFTNDALSHEPTQEEVPQEPEPVEVEYFYVETNTRPGGAPIKCEEASYSECGAKLERCSNGFNYYCVQNLKAEYRMELPKPE